MQYLSSILVSFISMTSVCSSEVEQVQKIMISEPNIQHGHEHTKWMSSKMRLMKKMMNSDQGASTSKPRRTHSVPESGFIRVCSDCNTTKTPLWRSGPQGPKSLCNACGIRQRKAKKLQSMMISSDGDRQGDCAMPFKKRFKITGTESATYHQRLLPQDEKDAAILLMALSCGLLHG